MLRGAAAAFCKEIRPHAANRVIAAGLCDLEGSSSAIAGGRKDAQTMQRGCSTGAKEAASRVFNVERIAASTASLLITIWPPFGAVQSIVLHLYPLFKLFTTSFESSAFSKRENQKLQRQIDDSSLQQLAHGDSRAAKNLSHSAIEKT